MSQAGQSDDANAATGIWPAPTGITVVIETRNTGVATRGRFKVKVTRPAGRLDHEALRQACQGAMIPREASAMVAQGGNEVWFEVTFEPDLPTDERNAALGIMTDEFVNRVRAATEVKRPPE